MRTNLAAPFAALALLATPAHAAPQCTVDALNALKIPNLTVIEARPLPSQCDIQGTVVTKGAGIPDGLARFAMQLPDAWQRRFLFLGVGGNAGNLIPSANATDRATALAKGYATIITDTGHVGDGTSAAWTLTPDGKPDLPKRIDFFHRAAHDVTIAGKAFAQAYYANKIEHAYFDGCSTGGRMAMMEAQRYPEDYDGVIAGDPMMSFHTYTARAAVQKAALVPGAYIPPATLQAIDARLRQRCDAIDGAKDGLIQSPPACTLHASDLLCRPGQTEACLNPAQTSALKSYTTPFRDRHGRTIFGPWPLADLSDPQGVPYTVTGRTEPDLANLAAPWQADAPRAFTLVQEMITYWLALGPKATVADLDIQGNVIGDKMLALMDATYADGNTRDPAKLQTFIAQNRKMILYHGASDPSIPPSQSIAFYNELTRQRGLHKTQDNVRLFLVPGMHHCSGGPAPDEFDTLSALEAWVEHAQPPTVIQAATKPDSPAQHRLPLCPYPKQARYTGQGDLTDPTNWRCTNAAHRPPHAHPHAVGWVSEAQPITSAN